MRGMSDLRRLIFFALLALFSTGCQPDPVYHYFPDDTATGDEDAADHDMVTPDPDENSDAAEPDALPIDADDPLDEPVTPDDDMAVPCALEGEPFPLDGTKCCDNLVPIENSYLDGSGGCVADPTGGQICTYCGDAFCGTGENECNCPGDCPGVVITCKSNEECLVRPPFWFCQKADGDCDGTGYCTDLSQGCTDPDPLKQIVCGCDGIEYNSTCEAWTAGVNVAFPSNCTP